MAREDVSVTKKQNSNADCNKLKVNGATESCDKAGNFASNIWYMYIHRYICMKITPSLY